MVSKFLLIIFGLGAALLYAFMQLPDGRMHVWFLDVGQGDAVLLETPEGHQILVDGGPNGRVIEELNEIMPFFDKSLDMIVLTHPDKDHIGGLVRVLQRYKVDNVLMTGVVDESSYYEAFLQELDSENILIAEASTDFRFGEVLLDVVYPFGQLGGQSFEKVNETSISTRVIYEDKIVLLTGDLGEVGEKELVNSGVDLRSDVYKVGHHGSKYSSSLDFLARVSPEYGVIQVGQNSYGHPTEDVLKRLKLVGVRDVFRNDIDGRIELVWD